MQCNCGGETENLEHKIKTEKKALEWVGYVVPVPIFISQDRCTACGRQMTTIYNSERKRILRRG